MNRLLAFLSFLVLALVAPAQALLILPESSDAHELHFNPLFIQRNGITTIIGQQLAAAC